MLWLIYLIIAIILMSFNPFIVKQLVKKVNPLIVMFFQFLIAIPLVLIYSLFFNPGSSNNPLLLILGFVYALSLGLYYSSLSSGFLSRAGPIFNLSLIVTAVLGLLFLGETLTPQLVIGLVFGAFGVYLLGDSK